MLVFAVLSPDAFRQECLESPGYQDQIAAFFNGLKSNAVLLVDADGKLLDEMEGYIAALKPKYRQDLQIRFDYLRENLRQKASRRYVVKCGDRRMSRSEANTYVHQCADLSVATSADALFIGADEPSDGGVLSVDIPVRHMAEYARTDFEEKRRWFMEDLPPIDKSKTDECDDLIRRATRYSIWLRIFDKQIGKGLNTRNFRRGIEHILALWSDCAYSRPEFVEIYTVESESTVQAHSSLVARRRSESNQKAYDKVIQDIIRPLQKKFPFTILLKLKQDQERICHSRHLQTQTSIVLFERGFDLFDDDGDLRRNTLKCDNGAAEHLAEYRALPEASTERS